LYDPDVSVPLVALQVNLLLVGPDDLEGLNLENVVYDAQKHGHVAKKLGRDALACRVDGDLAASTCKHERGCKHADADGLAKPVVLNCR
jgi:hypothetical protein